MRINPFASIAAASAAMILVACTTQPIVAVTTPNDDLTQALKESARSAVEVRIRLANMQSMPAMESTRSNVDAVPPEALARATARMDIDYVGPAENAVKLISRVLGWSVSISGKSRSDVIVSLRHSAQDGVTILKDIGAQCNHRCDVHVELVEAGKSTVALTYRD